MTKTLIKICWIWVGKGDPPDKPYYQEGEQIIISDFSTLEQCLCSKWFWEGASDELFGKGWVVWIEEVK